MRADCTNHVRWFRYGDGVSDPEHYLLSMIIDKNGNAVDDGPGVDTYVTYDYDESGRLEDVESPAGSASIKYEDHYDAATGQIVSGSQFVQDDLTGAITTVGYNTEGKVTEQIDPLGNSTRYRYYTDAEDDSAPEPKPGGGQIWNSHARYAGALASETDAEGRTTTYRYGNVELDNRASGFSDMFRDYINVILQGQNPAPQKGYLSNAVILPSSITVSSGQTTTTDYDLTESNITLGSPLSMTDPTGIVTEMDYNSANGSLETVARAGIEASTTSYYRPGEMIGNFQLSGRIKESTDAFGNVTHYDYHFYSYFTTPLGHYNWAEETIVTQNYGTSQVLTTHSFADAFGRTIKSVDARGVASYSSYDADGRLLQSQTNLNNTPISRSTVAYTPDGQQASQTIQYYDNGRWGPARKTAYEYDAVGRLIKTINPDGTFTRNRFYPNPGDTEPWPDDVGSWQGRAELSYDVEGRVSVTKYDLAGRVAESYSLATDAQGNVIKNGSATEYTPSGQTARSYRLTGKNGAVQVTLLSSNTYDADGRLTESKDEITGATVGYGYDSVGRQVWTRGANSIYTKTVYDAMGRVERVIKGLIHLYDSYSPWNPAQNYIRYAYDDATGVKTDEYVPTDDGTGNEIQTHYVYNQVGQVTGTVFNNQDGKHDGNDAADEDIVYEYEYDDYGNRTAFIDAKGHHTWYEYDALNRLTRKVLDAAGDGIKQAREPYEQYAYYGSGQMKTKRNYNGSLVKYEYDAVHDWQTKAEYPSDGLTVEYTYEPVTGRMRSVTEQRNSNSRVTSFSYDPVTGRPSLVAKPEGTLAYTYDVEGRLASVRGMRGTGDVENHYYYDPAGRLESVQTPEGIARYTYYNNGSRHTQTLPNGVVTTYAYDNLLRVDTIEHRNPQSQLLSSFDYTVGHSGKRLGVEEINGGTSATWDYSYDGLGRLTYAVRLDGTNTNSWEYEYDLVGNRIRQTRDGANTTYDYNALDQLLSEETIYGATEYAYDGNGNLSHKSWNGGELNYIFDSRNRLVQVYNGPVQGMPWLEYAYDYAQNRVAKAVNEAGHITGTGFLIDDNNLTGYTQALMEFDLNTGNPERRYDYADDLLTQVNTPTDPAVATPYHFLYDALGSTRSLTTTSLLSTEEYAYEPFGAALSPPSDPLTQIAFTGQFRDENTNLQYHRARWFDTSSDRFASLDPEEDSANGLHKYVYACNDPVSFADPSGSFTLKELAITVGILLLVGAIAIPVYKTYFTRAGKQVNLAPGYKIMTGINDKWAFVSMFANETDVSFSMNIGTAERLARILCTEFGYNVVYGLPSTKQDFLDHARQHSYDLIYMYQHGLGDLGVMDYPNDSWFALGNIGKDDKPVFMNGSEFERAFSGSPSTRLIFIHGCNILTNERFENTAHSDIIIGSKGEIRGQHVNVAFDFFKELKKKKHGGDVEKAWGAVESANGIPFADKYDLIRNKAVKISPLTPEE